jgi:hypothetical protein
MSAVTVAARLWLPFENPSLGSPVGFLVGGHDIGRALEFLSFRKRFQHLKRILARAIVSRSHEQVLLGRRELSSLEVMGRVCGRMLAEALGHIPSPLVLTASTSKVAV